GGASSGDAPAGASPDQQRVRSDLLSDTDLPRLGDPEAARVLIKRLFDVTLSASALLALSPVLAVLAAAVWVQDRRSPFYVAPRVGRGGAIFRMVKLRSMVVGADKAGVASTGATDPRVTRVGQFIRRYKLDELPQLWNVLKGDMSLIGPRPNVPSEVDKYTGEERRMLQVRPGVTD